MYFTMLAPHLNISMYGSDRNSSFCDPYITKLQEDLACQSSCGKEVIGSLLGLLVTLLSGLDVR